MSDSINRRDFLKMTVAAAAVAPLAFAEEAPKKKRAIKKGVGEGMIGAGSTVMEKFKLLKDLGFDGVELNRPGGPPAEEILKARDATGVQIGNIIDSAHWGDHFSHPDPAVRARGVKALEAALHDAKTFGCPNVLLVPAVVTKEISYADAYTRSVAEIRKAVPLAEKLGVKINIENVWNQFLLSPLEAARYVDEFKSPMVGWHFDVGNIINYGWPEHWVRILGKRIHCLHIKEYSRAKRDKEGPGAGFGVDLWDGDDDWPAVMKALDEVGFKGWAIAEINGGDANRLKVIAEKMDKIFAL